MTPAFEKLADAPYEALVVWWDCHTLAVLCPLCSEVESYDTQPKHGTFKWAEPVTLTALCRSTGVTYQAVFPWKIELGWEKNWECKRIDAIGIDLSELGIRESWQPTSMAISGQPLRARKDPLFWAARISKDRSGDSLVYRDGQQHGRPEANETQREERKSTGLNKGLEMPVPPFSPRTVLGDMRLMISQRPKSNCIQIAAPAATVGGISLPGPLALISSHKVLKHKTVAVLDRRGPYEPIIAVSGWKDYLRGADNVINQEFWSREVHELGDYFSHKLGVHNLDHGTEGRVSASHAEKQLMAFFVRMHCFLEDGYEEEKMDRLKMLPLHAGLQEAWIGLDKAPCENCKEFRDKIEAVCNVKLHFVVMKDDFRTKKDRKIEDLEEPKTPIRSSTTKFPLLTPPDSDTLPPKKEPKKVEEEEEYLDDEGDEDPESPCDRRNFRPLSRRLRPTFTMNDSYLSDTDPAFRTRSTQKRQRIESSDDSYSELEYSPPPSPAKRSSLSTKRSRRSKASASEPRRPAPTPSYANSRAHAPQTETQVQPQRCGHARLSAEDIMAVINEVADSLGGPERDVKQEEEEVREDNDASTDSDVPIISNRRGARKSSREKVVVDLTGDTTDEAEDSEGSCFSL
jgi:hypothetical protein